MLLRRSRDAQMARVAHPDRDGASGAAVRPGYAFGRGEPSPWFLLQPIRGPTREEALERSLSDRRGPEPSGARAETGVRVACPAA